MEKITLGGGLPPEETNGLATEAIQKAFLDHPKHAVLVVAVVSSQQTRTNHDKGITYPVLSIRHWEVVPEEHRAAVAKVLGDALAARTGLVALPFEPGGEVIPLEPLDDEDTA